MIIEGRDSKMVRVFAFFPFFIGFGFLMHAHSQHSDFSGLIGFLGIIIGVWTLKAQARRFIDTDAQVYATQSAWLWMQWETHEPLSRFNIDVITDNTSYVDETSRTSYDVRLIEKSGLSNAQEHVFEIYNSKAEAIQRAQFIAEKSGLTFNTE